MIPNMMLNTNNVNYVTLARMISHNKSLHPISPAVTAVAYCTRAAATAAPPVQSGELNRYNYLFSTKLNPILVV